MKKIIVAGCGLGGLSAAAAFAKAGYAVTVLEQGARDSLGFDWHDSLRKSTFEKAGIPMPDAEQFLPHDRMSYYNPKKTVHLVRDKQPSPNIGYIDRIFLIRYLMDYAIECGAEILFEAKVLGAVCEDGRVCGVQYEWNGEQRTAQADLVVDAAGLSSPVRASLPDSFGITKDVPDSNIFYVYRAYMEKTAPEFTDPASTIFFYHCSLPGMSWAITKEDYIDVLIGGFGGLTTANVEEAMQDFYALYPYMGKKILRGGRYEKIPLGKTMPLLVANGYAAVGNSAGMTEPLSGSGMDMSIHGGKILADAVLEADGKTDIATLWKYNYQYFKSYAQKHYNDAIIKNFLSNVTADDIDFLFENRIMTEKEVAGSGGKYSVSDILKKLNILRRPKLVAALLPVVGKILTAGKLRKTIPETYDPKKVADWLEIYKTL